MSTSITILPFLTGSAWCHPAWGKTLPLCRALQQHCDHCRRNGLFNAASQYLLAITVPGGRKVDRNTTGVWGTSSCTVRASIYCDACEDHSLHSSINTYICVLHVYPASSNVSSNRPVTYISSFFSFTCSSGYSTRYLLNVDHSLICNLNGSIYSLKWASFSSSYSELFMQIYLCREHMFMMIVENHLRGQSSCLSYLQY